MGFKYSEFLGIWIPRTHFFILGSVLILFFNEGQRQQLSLMNLKCKPMMDSHWIYLGTFLSSWIGFIIEARLSLNFFANSCVVSSLRFEEVRYWRNLFLWLRLVYPIENGQVIVAMSRHLKIHFFGQNEYFLILNFSNSDSIQSVICDKKLGRKKHC